MQYLLLDFIYLFFPSPHWNSGEYTVYPAAQIPVKNVGPDCIPVQAEHAVNNALPFFPSSLLASPQCWLYLSPSLSVSINYWHPIDLTVRTAGMYLNLSFGVEVCAAFYCQNSLTERLNPLKTSETGIPRLEPLSLCPHSYPSRDFHQMFLTLSRNSLLLGELRETTGMGQGRSAPSSFSAQGLNSSLSQPKDPS